MCVNNLSKVAAAGIEPAISSRKSNALTTTPPSHTGKTIITSVNWTLQIRYTADGGDMNTYFVMYKWSKTFTAYKHL